MNVLFLDIERAPMILYSHQRFDTTIPDHKIKQDAFVISACWSWNDEKKIHRVSVLDDPKRFKKDHTDDYHVIKTIRDQIEKADYVVGHYIKGFDWPVIHGGVMYHGLKILKKPKLVDTLAEARKAKYSSNKLDFLAKKFGFEGKVQHRSEMLDLCADGDEDAIRECVRYNAGDIDPMRNLYNQFRPYTLTTQYPNECDGETCPYCKSRSIRKEGIRAKRQRYFCNDCQKYSRGEP